MVLDKMVLGQNATTAKMKNTHKCNITFLLTLSGSSLGKLALMRQWK